MNALSVAAILSWLSLCAFADSEISVRNLNPSNVKGLLGKPLGTRTIIAGQYTSAMLANPLKVTEIDGVAVKNSIVIDIRGQPKLKEGVSYRFEGYESGEFGSQPTWLAPGAQQPFQFYSFFVVTSVVEPK